MSWGSCNRITSKEECEAAARELALPDTEAQEESESRDAIQKKIWLGFRVQIRDKFGDNYRGRHTQLVFWRRTFPIKAIAAIVTLDK